MSLTGDAERLLGERGLSPALAQHCRGVATTARRLAERYGADPEQAEAAGLLHDWCRELSEQEVLELARKHGLMVDVVEADYPVQLLHARLAAAELESRGVPPPVLEAIASHTVGGPGMSRLARCVMLADAIEPGRGYAGVADVRAAAERGLDEALTLVVARDVARLRKRGRAVHPRMAALAEELSVG